MLVKGLEIWDVAFIKPINVRSEEPFQAANSVLMDGPSSAAFQRPKEPKGRATASRLFMTVCQIETTWTGHHSLEMRALCAVCNTC